MNAIKIRVFCKPKHSLSRMLNKQVPGGPSLTQQRKNKTKKSQLPNTSKGPNPPNADSIRKRATADQPTPNRKKRARAGTGRRERERERKDRGGVGAYYELSDGFGEEAVVAAVGGSSGSSGLEVEVGQHPAIGQRLQQQLLREIFSSSSSLGRRRSRSKCGGGGGEAMRGEAEEEEEEREDGSQGKRHFQVPREKGRGVQLRDSARRVGGGSLASPSEEVRSSDFHFVSPLRHSFLGPFPFQEKIVRN